MFPSTPIIPHNNVCALAQLTMLVYEYGVSITPDDKTPIETFVSDIIHGKRETLKNQLRMDVITQLAKKSPNGRVHKFFSNEETDLQVGITVMSIAELPLYSEEVNQNQIGIMICLYLKSDYMMTYMFMEGFIDNYMTKICATI